MQHAEASKSERYLSHISAGGWVKIVTSQLPGMHYMKYALPRWFSTRGPGPKTAI